MGIHSGPVNEVTDLNEQANIAGAGINVAQRVMDCGDSGHILLSKRVADDLEQYPQWRSRLHELGECEVKHGVRLSIVNLYTDELGNTAVPSRLAAAKRTSPSPGKRLTTFQIVLAVLIVLICLGIPALIFTPAILKSWQSIPKTDAAPPTGGDHNIPAKSIAVLPFENLSDDKANAYFAEGIQDEILTRLAGIADLKVISRTSTAKYKSKPEDLKIVSQQLGAANIVEGTVQRSADKVRVNVQLIDARADSHLWAKSYDGDIKDVFAVESKVSQEIADTLQAKLSPNEASALETAPTQDSEAHDLFLKAEYEERAAESSLKGEPFDRAAAFYRQALERDPKFALAAARLAESRILRHWFVTRLSPNDKELEEIKSLADRAVALAPNLPEAHVAVGSFFYYVKLQYEDALKEFGRALELQPNNLRALELSAYIHRRQGNWKRSLAELDECQKRDPQDASLAGNIASLYATLRMWPEAKRAATHGLVLDPHNLLGARMAFLSCMNGAGDMDEARRLLAPGLKVTNFVTLDLSATESYLYVLDGDFAAARKACAAETASPDEIRSRLTAIAVIHLLANDVASAREEIEKTRNLLEARILERPDDVYALLQMAWVNLTLKRNADALRLAAQAAEISSVEKDALLGPIVLDALAQIQARTGEADASVKTLEHLLAIPAGMAVSIAQLKVNPMWDPIRNHPGFQKLLAGPELVGPPK
jgi:TolB-like protein/Flp pilus assembly protein TadD